MPSEDQQQRREQLFDLLQTGAARTQQALVDELKSLGINATQSSVSRDLKDLGAVKTRDGYALPAANDNGDEDVASVAALVRELSAAGPNMLVIRTGAGAAQRVALVLDRCDWPGIVGNIGGDDTVFVAVESLSHQRLLLPRLKRAFGLSGNGT